MQQSTGFQVAKFGAGTRQLKVLQISTLRINNCFAAARITVSLGDATAYGGVQCAETISRSGYEDCLTVAYGSIQGYLPDTDGSAIHRASSLRYSEAPLYLNNNTPISLLLSA